MQGVQFCSRLFDCERYSKAKNHTAEQRKQFRHEKEKPILETFWNWPINSVQTREPVWQKRVDYYPNRKRHPDDLSGSTVIAVYPVILARMQSDHSLLAGKTGCSVPVRRELPLALLCIQWLRWQKRIPEYLQISDIPLITAARR